MASATLVVVLNGDPLSPLSVTLDGTKASHTTTFSRPMDANFSMSGDEWMRFRMGVAQWAQMTGEYEFLEVRALSSDAMRNPRTSAFGESFIVRTTHPTFSTRRPVREGFPYGEPGFVSGYSEMVAGLNGESFDQVAAKTIATARRGIDLSDAAMGPDQWIL